MAGMLGKEEGHGLYEHAYSVPNAVSILPSTTIAAWSAIFTGAPTAWNWVPGNEWFVREDMKFFAPVPVSVEEMDDNRAMITEGWSAIAQEPDAVSAGRSEIGGLAESGLSRRRLFYACRSGLDGPLFTEFVARGE